MILPNKDTIFMMFVFLSVIVGFLVKQLKEQTQNYVEIVEVYIKQVLVPLEKCPRIVEIGKDELIDIQWTAKKKSCNDIGSDAGNIYICVTYMGRKIHRAE